MSSGALTPNLDQPSTPTSLGARFENLLKKLTAKPLFWVAFIGTIAAYVILRSVLAEIPKPPPPMFEIPAFSLVDQENEAFGDKQLRGKIWVANFMFTSCPTMCPMLTQKMQEIRYRSRNFGDQIHLVSFSVDPERDTPEVLKKYAEKYGASRQRWSFLTGSLSAIEEVVIKGFKQPIDPGEVEKESNLFDITHGSRFILVDRQMHVRGLYDASDQGLDDLMSALKLLAAQDYTVMTSGQRALKQVAPHALESDQR